ncbi:hypothetical protein ACF1G0_34010 [Streptomyces sp. NPDC013953]|uniref:hypothetical protein n=1 Tax=Streptomyces sp. NPDC013953 TaxID=3364868 RepID=UPI0036F58891
MRTDAFRRPGRTGRTAQPVPVGAVHPAVVPVNSCRPDTRRPDEDAVALPVLSHLSGVGAVRGDASAGRAVATPRRRVGLPVPEKARPRRTTVDGGGSPRRIAA